MNYTKKERDEYNAHRNRVSKKLGLTTNQYNYLRRNGEKLRQIYEDNCNGTITETDYEVLVNKQCTIIENYLTKINNFSIFYQSDPRGATIYLSKEKIDANNYDRASCVY